MDDLEDFDLSDFEPAQPAPSIELAAPYRRLVELVNVDPSRLDLAGSLALLTESGLTAEFDDLFRHAADLGLNVSVVAAIVVARLLGGTMGEFMSGDAQLALASLQERAQEVTNALREMGRHGVAFARLTQEPLAREVLRQTPGDDRLERLAGIRELLDRLEDALRRSGDH